MSDIKSLWNAKERQKGGVEKKVLKSLTFLETKNTFLNPNQQVQDEPELAMMASTAQEAATLALIENDSKV